MQVDKQGIQFLDLMVRSVANGSARKRGPMINSATRLEP
jgi:hypothetical protein